MTRDEVYKKELNKLNEIFSDVDESYYKLAEGLIINAATLYAENYELRKILNKTGTIKIHPDNFQLQKALPIGDSFRKNVESYSNVINRLSNILQKKIDDDDEDMDEYE